MLRVATHHAPPVYLLRFATFSGKKLIRESDAPGYVARKQAHFEDCDIDPRKLLGLKKSTKAAPAAEKEKDNGS